MIDSILSNGLKGVQAGLQNAAKHSEEASTALQENGSGDLVTPAVHLNLDKLQVQASARVIGIGSELQDSVLDILA